jgi:predicted metal-binding protein
MAERPVLTVCTSCRAGRPLAEGETPPGRLLHDALAAALAAHSEPPVELNSVACMAACERGCTAAIAAPGKWTYLLGGLTRDGAGDLLAYGAAYAGHATGALLPSRRPESLRRAVIARLPDFTTATAKDPAA